MSFQKSKYRCFSYSLLLTLAVRSQQPVISYLDNFSFSDTASMKPSGLARLLSMHGRKGLNMTSISSVLELKAHNLKSSKGTVTIWVKPMEELSSFDTKLNFGKSNAHFYFYSFLSDCSNPSDFVGGHFKLAWTPRWHPSLIAQFGQGSFYEEAFNIPHKALISVSYFSFKKLPGTSSPFHGIIRKIPIPYI